MICQKIVEKVLPAERRLDREWQEAPWCKVTLEEPTALGTAIEMRDQSSGGLPLIIKNYHKDGCFTQQLFANPQTHLEIYGPKGRGLCI
jgi:hypothetical protein